MKILQVAPLYESVPPKLYGGSERVVSNLTEELVRRGHQVTLFASGDSVTSARLVAPCEIALRLDKSTLQPLAYHILALGMAYEMAADFDIVHSHDDYYTLPFARTVRTPTLITLHGRLDIPELHRIYDFYHEAAHLVSISKDQQTYMPSGNWIRTVHHGLMLKDIPVGQGEGGYLAFLGRISPEKRPDLAIETAKQTGLPLKIAAKVDKADLDYFEKEIRHLLDHPLIEFIGEINEAEKIRFLGDARALLFPIDWPEPFGLVMIEAMACGAPVIARRCGSAPEIVAHAKTGFLANELEELVAAVKKIDTIDRGACRKHVEKYFSIKRMVDDYEAVYQQLVASTTNKPQPSDFSLQSNFLKLSYEQGLPIAVDETPVKPELDS